MKKNFAMSGKHQESKLKILICFCTLLCFGLFGIFMVSVKIEASEMGNKILYEAEEVVNPEVLYKLAENNISDDANMTTDITASLTNNNTHKSVDADTVETTQHLSTIQEADGSITENYVTTVFLDEISAENKEKVGFEGYIGISDKKDIDYMYLGNDASYEVMAEEYAALMATNTSGEQFSEGYDGYYSVKGYAKVYYSVGIVTSGLRKGYNYLDLTHVKGTWQKKDSSVSISNRRIFGKAEHFFADGSRGSEVVEFHQAGDTGPAYATNTKAVITPQVDSLIRCTSICTISRANTSWYLTVSTTISG